MKQKIITMLIWHFSTIGITQQIGATYEKKNKKESEDERIGVALFVYLYNCSQFRTCFGERASLENVVFLTLLRCVSSIKEPSRSYTSSCQFCVGGPVVNRGGNTPTCRHESLQHRTRTISLEPPKPNNNIGSSHENDGFVNGLSRLQILPIGSNLKLYLFYKMVLINAKTNMMLTLNE